MDADAELAELKATVTYLKDRADILDCIQRESRARDRQDVDMISGCWWPEGVDEHGAVIATADVYPEKANAGHRGGFQQTSHNITNQVIHALEANAASVESYVVGGLHWLKDGPKGGTVSLGIGRYLDQMEKRDGEWRILTRRCTIEMTLDGDDSWLEADAIKGFLKGLWSKDDPSYAHPYEWKTNEEGLRW